MCGIAGLLGPRSESGGDGVVDHMLSALAHRGPDDRGCWTTAVSDTALSLGATRLAILDLSSAGRQPMIDEATGCVLVYNGEIYNYAEVRAELVRLDGEALRSTGDTEVLLRAYRRWGSGCVGRLRGMFAFALYDPRSHRLLLGRGHLGIKPLYVTRGSGGRVAFASEVRALLGLSWVRRNLDPVGLVGCLAYGSVQGPHTLVSGIRSLPPGHTLEIEVGRGEAVAAEPVPFWRPGDIATSRDPVRGRDAAARVRATLAESVQLHTASDVPLGVFLSGGLDSSSVVALAAEAAPDVRTLTVCFEEAAFDESAIARAVADRYGTRHTEVRLSGGAFLADLRRWIDSIDQPSADGANTWVVSKACREAGVTVALSGLGADEIFGGYSIFERTARAARVAGLVQRLPTRAVAAAADALRVVGAEKNQVRKMAHWLADGGSLLAAYLTQRRFFMTEECRELLDDRVLELGGRGGLTGTVVRELEDLAAAPDVMAAISLLEVSTYLPNTVLRDTDQASMAHSVEVRVPFIDREVLRTVLGIPGSVRMTGPGPKPLLRAAMGSRLDPAWIERPKMTFSFPFDDWLRGPLREEVAEGLRTLHGFPFRPGTVETFWRRFLGGSTVVTGIRMLLLYVLAAWIRRHRMEGAA